MKPLSLGLDFGTESVRALLVDLQGRERGVGVAKYPHGQIVDALPGDKRKLPSGYALQDPEDWLGSAGRAVRGALRAAKAKSADVVGIGVDFTSCTMLPTLADGTPLCALKKWRSQPLAWPKLWKHHGAVEQTERINSLARERREPWLARYGGIVGLEWFFPKVLETLEHAPRIYMAAEVWIEAGDWFVWQLVGGPAQALPRSSCQAGYKAMWSREDGYPSPEFFRALDSRLEHVGAEKLPGRLLAPGE